MIQIKQITTALFFVLLTVNCTNHSQTSNKNTTELENAEKLCIDTLVDRENVKVMLRADSVGYWSVIHSIEGKEQILNLEKESIPQKTPALVWANEDYACIVTWWSQAQSRHIFIPLKEGNKFIYLNKDIKEMDSINNNIVFVDTICENKNEAIFAVENLLTRKYKKAHPIRINVQNSIYPFYDRITMTKDEVEIATGSGTQIIDIGELY
jgi:hypothetical protein